MSFRFSFTDQSCNLTSENTSPTSPSETASITSTKETSQAVKIDSDQLHVLPNLPQADGGKDAWLFLAGCFVFEALIWGFPFSFGVFQSYYTTHPPFSTHPNGIAAIGTCSSGVMYLWAPVSLFILEGWPAIRRLSSVFGLIVIVSALIVSSFATEVWQLIITQGVLCAIGGSFLYSPTMFYLDEWFIKKKGLAFGVMWAGSSTSGLIFPFFLNQLLTTYGYATTLRIWALILIIFCTPLIFFVKPRLPLLSQPTPRQPISYAFITSRTHLFLQASNILESLGFFIPFIYLPLYASSLGLPSYTGILLLSILNASSILGAIGLGALCDRLHVTTVIVISTIGSAVSVFVFWGMATELPQLVLFVVGYGCSAGGFSAMWAGMMRAVQEDSCTSSTDEEGEKRGEQPKMGILMGLFAAGRGIGAVLSGPISEVLLIQGRDWVGKGLLKGFGTEFGILIVFTGASALAGFVGLGARRFRRGGGRGAGEKEREKGVVGDNDSGTGSVDVV